MASDALKEIVARLQKQGKMAWIEGATEDQIQAFEKKQNLELPSGYKSWLKFSDGGECFLPAGIQLYGVGHRPCIDANNDDRPNDQYVVIGALSTGDSILCMKDGEQISIYNHEAGRIEKDEIYIDFFAFLMDLESLLGIGE